MTARQIDLERVTSVLKGKTLTRGRYYDHSDRTAPRDAIGQLAHAAGITDVVLSCVDTFAAGRGDEIGTHVVKGPYLRAHFVRDCHVIDRALAQAYGITPADRLAICDVNDVFSDADSRWMAVCGLILSRNKILATGADPDDVALTHYRGSIAAAFELSRDNRAPLREK